MIDQRLFLSMEQFARKMMIGKLSTLLSTWNDMLYLNDLIAKLYAGSLPAKYVDFQHEMTRS